MAASVSEKDKKQIKFVSILVIVLLLILIIALAFPKKKQYTPEQMAVTAIRYVAENNYISNDSQWPDWHEWQIQTANDSYSASCTFQVANINGIYIDHTINGLVCYDSSTDQWHVSSLLIDGKEVIEQE